MNQQIKDAVQNCREQNPSLWLAPNGIQELTKDPENMLALLSGFTAMATVNNVGTNAVPEHEIEITTFLPRMGTTNSSNTLQENYEISERLERKPYEDIQLERAGEQLSWHSGFACVAEELGITYKTSDGREWTWDSENSVPASFQPVDTPHAIKEDTGSEREL